MAATDGSITSYAVESTPGVLAGTEPFRIVPFQSVEPSAVRNFGDAQEARDDYFDTEDDELSRDAGLSFKRVFRGYANDDFFEMALFSRWARIGWRENGYGGAAAEITDVDNGTSTYTVTDPGGARLDFAPNLLVLASGFANAANNGLKKATTGSNGTSLIITGSTLVDETPGAGAKLEIVGIELASGDLAISGNDLISTAGVDFVALVAAAKGRWLKIGDGAAPTSFATAAVNDGVRIGDIPAAGTLTLDRRPSGWANDAGTGKTVRLFFAEPILPANNPKTISWLTQIRRPTDFKRKLIKGLYAERLTIDGQARDYFNFTAQFRGLDFADDPGDLNNAGGGPIRDTISPAMRTGYSGQRLYLNGTYSTKTAAVRSSSLIIEPTLVPIDIEGYPGYCAFDRSTQKVMINGEAHFQTDAIYSLYQTSTKVGYARIMNAGNQAYVMDVKRLQFKTVQETLPGRGQAVTISFESKATADDDGVIAGDFNNFFSGHRFRYSAGWPDLATY